MLTIYDHIVIVFYLLFMFAIGFVFKAFCKNSSDYFRGGGSMLWWMVGASAFMTQFSAWTFTGAASEAYTNGTLVAMIFFANALGYFLNYLWSSYRFRQMRVVTPMEALRDRYGRFNEQVFTWLTVPFNIVYAGIWLNGLAVVTSAIFGLDFTTTIIVVACVVVFMSVSGGSWAVVASDFIQMLIIMLISIVVVAKTLSMPEIGGLSGLMEKVPEHHFNWSKAISPQIVYLWIFAMFIHKFIGLNGIQDAYRFLSVKDGREARKASLLACGLMLLGPLIWFIPPMAARVLEPDIGTAFPLLVEAGRNPAEAAYIFIGHLTLPQGMLGLLACGIFAATMSSMDTGLNRTAGIIIKNFYQPFIARKASETHLLMAGKGVSLGLGILIVCSALFISSLRELDLFNIMLQFGTLVVFPLSIPMVWCMIIKRAPAWSGWSTIVVGMITSWWMRYQVEPETIARLIGVNGGLSKDEIEFQIVFSGIIAIVSVSSVWFLLTMYFDRFSPPAYRKKVDEFFKRMNTPVNFQEEMGKDKDNLQLRTLGILCLVYGGFIVLMGAIPNDFTGRLCFAFCGGTLCLIGTVLYRSSRSKKTPSP